MKRFAKGLLGALIGLVVGLLVGLVVVLGWVGFGDPAVITLAVSGGIGLVAGAVYPGPFLFLGEMLLSLLGIDL